MAFDLLMQVFCKELKCCKGFAIFPKTSVNQRQIKDAHFMVTEVEA